MVRTPKIVCHVFQVKYLIQSVTLENIHVNDNISKSMIYKYKLIICIVIKNQKYIQFYKYISIIIIIFRYNVTNNSKLKLNLILINHHLQILTVLSRLDVINTPWSLSRKDISVIQSL